MIHKEVKIGNEWYAMRITPVFEQVENQTYLDTGIEIYFNGEWRLLGDITGPLDKYPEFRVTMTKKDADVMFESSSYPMVYSNHPTKKDQVIVQLADAAYERAMKVIN